MGEAVKKLQVMMLVDFMASSFGSTDDEYNEIEQSITGILPDCKLTFEREMHMHKLKLIDLKGHEWVLQYFAR